MGKCLEEYDNSGVESVSILAESPCDRGDPLLQAGGIQPGTRFISDLFLVDRPELSQV